MAAALIATTSLLPGQRVTVEIGGSLPVYLTDSIFRERLTNQLQMSGLNVERITIESGYGVVSRDYRAVAIVTTLTQSRVYGVIGQVTSAVEGAGSYSPTVTVPAIGQAPQVAPAPGPIATAAGRVLDALGTAAEGIAETPGALFSTTKLVVVGIVVIAALVAFGPNLRGIARR